MSTSVAPAMVSELRRLAADSDMIHLHLHLHLHMHMHMHLHLPDPMAALALWTARPSAPLVVQWRSDKVRQRLALRLYELLQRWALGRAAAIIATSLPYSDSSPALHPWRHEVRVIPTGISDNGNQAWRLKATAIRQRFCRRLIVLSLGRMTYYKGLDVLIDAASALPEDCLVVVGVDGELLEHYRTVVIKRGLAGKVHLVGHIDDELPSFFEACDVFCMPSTLRAEAYGVAIVEAMVMAKPIASTDMAGSGVPWVNRHASTGFKVPVRQPERLAESLRLLLKDPELRRWFGEAARACYAEEFNIKLMTDKTIDLYRALQPAA